MQAFVIPTGSMEDTLLIGDHLLVDKLAYAPRGPVSKYMLPYTEVKRGDIIVFRYPVDIQQTFVKRCIGVPGDHIRLVDKQLILNGHPVNEPYVYHKTEYIDSYRDNFPSEPNVHVVGFRQRHAEQPRAERRSGGAAGLRISPWATIAIPRSTAATGASCRASNIIGKPLIIYWSYDAPTEALSGPVDFASTTCWTWCSISRPRPAGAARSA